jgi:hypothetical protein
MDRHINDAAYRNQDGVCRVSIDPSFHGDPVLPVGGKSPWELSPKRCAELFGGKADGRIAIHLGIAAARFRETFVVIVQQGGKGIEQAGRKLCPLAVREFHRLGFDFR